MLDSLRNVTLIHEGAHSCVFRADLDDGTPVVMKVNREEHPSPRRLAAARREYELLSAIDSDAVVRPVGLHADGHRVALLLEDTGATSLDKLVRSGTPLPLDQFFTVAADLTTALTAVHAAGIIHLDVKPANVLVHPETWRAQLIDFNMSRTARSVPSTPARSIVGSLQYVSPEQTGRINRPVDQRSDLYSLGVTLYELLCGRTPFSGASAAELVHGHLARRPTPVRDLRPDCPAIVSDIVGVLLSKSADQRYQSAAGVGFDLASARDAIRTGAPQTFALRQHDIPQQLVMSGRLYGREADNQALLAACKRAADGDNAVLVVSGPSGVGKSALIRETRRLMAGKDGFFVEGKFDQYRRLEPYASLAQALRQLTLQLLAEEPEELARWRSEIADAVGASGQVLVDVVPEIELLLGPQPPAAVLPPDAALNRIGLVFGAFISLFARSERPLVLFLDDLQWADDASLKLLELLTTDGVRRGVLVVGACRDDDEAGRRRLVQSIAAIRAAGGSVSELTLGPLDTPAVAAWIRDSFGGTPADAEARAELLVAKTGGNPFFLTRFVSALHEDGLLTPGSPSWHWDDSVIRSREFTSNVVELVTRKLETLPAAAQELVRVAACLGASFTLRALAVSVGRPLLDTGRTLQPAVIAGLLLPLDEDHRLLSAWVEAEAGPVPEDFDCRFRFLHDRVQQAAYRMSPAEERAQIHHLAGQRLLESAGEDHLDEHIFEIVGHLNAASDVIEDGAAVRSLVELNLRAARRARASGAYGPAASLLDVACSQLPRVAIVPPGLERALLLERGISRAQLGRGPEASADFEGALQLSTDADDLVDVRMAWIQGLLYAADYLGVLEQGAAALVDLGVELPETADARAARGLELLEDLTRDLTPEGILAMGDLPEMGDPVAIRVAGVLAAISPSAHMTDHSERWFMWVAFRGLQLFSERGNAVASCHGYSLVGMTLCAIGDVARGYAFHRLAVTLAERYADPVQLSRTTTCFGFHQSLRESHAAAAETGRRAWRHSLDAGDWFDAQWASVTVLRSRLHGGTPLASLRDDAVQFDEFLRSRGPEMAALCVPMRDVADRLSGAAADASPYASEDHEWFESVDHLENEALRVWTQTAGLLCLLVEGRNAEVCELARRIWPRYLVFRRFGDGGELHFIHGMAAASHAPGSDGDSQEARGQLTELEVWACESPAAYGAKAALLRAAIAEAEGELEVALDGYLEVPRFAGGEIPAHVEALAALGAARIQTSRGRASYAALHRTDARRAWLRWGATRLAKGSVLDLARPQMRPPAGAPSTGVSWPYSSTVGAGSDLDLTAVLDAANTLASQTREEELIRRVARLASENAGADTGALVVLMEGGARLRATWTMPSDGSYEFQTVDTPLEQAHGLAVALVRYVLRTREAVVVDRVDADPRFARAARLAARGIQSALAIPLERGGTTSAVLILENRLTPAVFAPERVRLLTMLSSHMAIALDNARLVAELQQARDAAVALGEDLAAEVASRGLALTSARQIHGAVLGALSEGVVGVGPDGRVRLANPAAHALLAADADALVGVAFHDAFHAPAEGASPTDPCPVCWSDANTTTAEAQLRRADGTTIVVEWALRHVPEAPSEVVRVLSFRDVRRRKELESRLLESRKLEALGQFVAGVAHEFNNLLTPLMGHVSLLRAGEQEGSRRGRALADMQVATQRAAALVERLLAFGRRSTLTRAPRNVVEMAAEVAHRLAGALPASLQLSFAAPEEPMWIQADGQLVAQVLQSLIDNAREALMTTGFTPTGPGHITVTVEGLDLTSAEAAASGSTLERGRYVVISVADNGPGVEAAIREHLFEPFFTTHRLGEGTGLGLPAVQGMVQQHRGGVTLLPAPGGGSVFRVYLPRRDPPTDGTSTPERGAGDLERRRTALVIDDEGFVREVVSCILEPHGFDTLEAENGKVGVELLVQCADTVDIVLLDLAMPIMDGWAALAAIRERGYAVPVLLLSGYDFVQVEADEQAQGFLPKPFTSEQLWDSVERVLDSHPVAPHDS